MVQHLGRVLAAAHQRSDLFEAETGVAQGDRVALTLGKLSDVSEQGVVLHPLLGHACGVFARDGLMLDGATQLLATPVGPEMVKRGVAGDAEQPRRGRGVPRLKAPVRLVGVHEHLRGDVLGVGGSGDLRSDIRIDTTKVVAIQVFKRRRIGKQGRFMVLARPSIEATQPKGRL